MSALRGDLKEPSTCGPPEIPFVIVTPTGKADSKARRLIRRHVMIGKNLGKTRQPKRKPALAGAATGGKLVKKRDILPAPPVSSARQVIPTKVGSELSLLRFADGLDPSTVSAVFEFSSIAKQAMFPLESCLLFDRRQKIGVEAMSVDAAYLHSTVLATQVYLDLVVRRRRALDPSLKLSLHFSRSIRLLCERLSMGDGQAVSDLTASAVLSLALYSFMMGDYEGSACHMTGLRRIVDLKGGLVAFDDNPKLRFEMLRCDISLALYTGTAAFFYGDPFLAATSQCPLLWDCALPYAKGVLGTPGHVCSPESLDFLSNIHPELARLWDLMTQFSRQINLASQARSKLSPNLIFNTTASVMYRLLDMSFAVGSLDESVRLGLLAFSSSVFLQWRGVRPPYPHFPAAYRECLTKASLLGASPQLWLWLLVIGAISVFDEPDNLWVKLGLRVCMDNCGLRDWHEVRDVLGALLWVGLVHDAPGRRVVDQESMLRPTQAGC